MYAIRGAASSVWTPQPATSTAVRPLLRGIGPAANDNWARRSRMGQVATDALVIASRLLLGAGGFGIIATVACLLGLGPQSP